MKRLAVLIVAVFLFFNCAQFLQKKPLSTESITFQEIRNRIKQNYGKLQSIKGRAHLSVEMPGMGFTVVSQIALKTPDSLLFNVKAGFGMGVGAVFVARDSFTIFSSMENKVYTGDINSFDLSQFFQLHIQFQDLIGLISGIPIILESNDASLSVNENKYLITVKNNRGIKKYWVDPEKFVITDLYLYNAKNELIVEQEFRGFQKERGVILPKTIKVTRPQSSERITLHYSARKTNGKLNRDDFVFKIPENAQKVNL